MKGEPEALLVVEFAEADQAANLAKLKQLSELMGDLGFGWDRPKRKWGGVVDVIEPAMQAAITDFRTSGLNIMMSMKQEGKPVSFVEDCAVPLPHLADYTERLNKVFEKHGTRGTMYAHASEGCLHVRPVLNLKLDKDVKAMRAIAEEAFAMVREYKGSHSGEHGDGLVRSEFHAQMFGPQIIHAFEEVKERFDPDNTLNPGKIVHPPKMDDRSLFRYAPGYKVADIKTVMDWSAYPGAAGGFQGAVEMCNNNGACRKLEGGVMCPSYRATRNEQDVTRGRANTLRLAISGQLGPDALSSDSMMETMKLCVSCKACRHECPTGVDMAKMKIEVLAARAAKHGLTLRPYSGLCVIDSRRVSRGLPIYVTTVTFSAHCWTNSPASAPSATCRNSAAMCSRRAVSRSAPRTVAKLFCSLIPSIVLMNAKISTPRCAFSSKAAIAFICPAQSMVDAHCAAAAPSCPQDWSTTPALNSGAWWKR